MWSPIPIFSFVICHRLGWDVAADATGANSRRRDDQERDARDAGRHRRESRPTLLPRRSVASAQRPAHAAVRQS